MPRLASARSKRCNACGSAPAAAASSATGRGPAASRSARPSLAATWMIWVVRKPMICSRSSSRRRCSLGRTGRTWFIGSPFEVEAESVDGAPLALEVEPGEIADIEVVLRVALEPHGETELARHLLELGAVQGEDLPSHAPGPQHARLRQLPADAAPARLRIDRERAHAGPLARHAVALDRGVAIERGRAEQRTVGFRDQKILVRPVRG